MRTSTAGIVAALLVVAAAVLGLGASVLARRPPPTPVVVTFTPAPTTPPPAPTTDPAVFRQRLAGGCATADNVWVVSDGGTLIRYAGRDWEQVDATLRSLVRAACDDRGLIAVGPAGGVLLVDESAQTVSSVYLGVEDLWGVAVTAEGDLVTGANGEVQLLAGGSWQPFAEGIRTDLLAIAAFSLRSAWAVGAGGASYRLEPAGWRAVPTGVQAALRAVAATAVTDAVAVGDAGTVLRFDGTGWRTAESGVSTTLRDVIVAPALWIVGDGGVVLTGEPLRRLDIGTSCDLRAVFAKGQDVWIVGSAGSRGGVWRLRGGAVAEKWGVC